MSRSVKTSEVDPDDEDELLEKPRRPCMYSLLMNVLGLSSLTMIIAGLVWLSYEGIVATDPLGLFEQIDNCFVVNVTKEFFTNVDTCMDRFQYDFARTPTSALVISQQEDVNRTNITLCTEPDAVDLSAARFQAGQSATCYVIDPGNAPIAALYIPTLNCGEPSPPCYSILPVTTTHKFYAGLLGSAAIFMGGFTLMFFFLL